MGLISRHAGAPFDTGETLASADLEADISAAYTEINGNLDNANVKSGANLNGNKLLDNSIKVAKVTNSTLTVSKFAASAVPKHHVATITSSQAWTANTSLTDISNLTSATLTPGSTNDMIFVDLCVTLDVSGAGNFVIGWSINGVDYDDITTFYTDLTAQQVLYSSYAIAAPAASSMTIKPRHKVVASAGTGDIDTAVFRCWILPGK